MRKIIFVAIVFLISYTNLVYARYDTIIEGVRAKEYEKLESAVKEISIKDIPILLEDGEASKIPHFMNELFVRIVMFSDNLDVVEYMAKKGADFKYDDAAIILASRYNKNPSIASELVKLGADVNYKNQFGRSALFYSKSVEIASALVKAGADVNVKDNEGRTALMRSLANKNLDIARYLIDAGANVKISDNRRDTALVYLTEMGIDAPDIVQKMIDGGVNVNKAECYKPLDYARRKNLKETEKLLVKAGANTKDERQTCYDGNVFIEYNYKGSAFRDMKEYLSKSYIQFKDWLDEM